MPGNPSSGLGNPGMVEGMLPTDLSNNRLTDTSLAQTIETQDLFMAQADNQAFAQCGAGKGINLKAATGHSESLITYQPGLFSKGGQRSTQLAYQYDPDANVFLFTAFVSHPGAIHLQGSSNFAGIGQGGQSGCGGSSTPQFQLHGRGLALSSLY